MQAIESLLTTWTAPQIILASVLLGLFYVIYQLLNHLDGRAAGTSRFREGLESPPGGFPILGHLLPTIRTSSRQIEEWFEMKRDQKDRSKWLSVTIPGIRIIDISKPAFIQYVQKTNFSNYAKGPLFADVMHDVFGDGIFVVDGEKWVTQRKATSKIFNANNFRGIIGESIETDIKKLQIILGRHADHAEVFDISTLFLAFTLDSFTSMAFGVDTGALSVDGSAPVPFASAFDFTQGQLARRFNNPFWRLTESFFGGGKQMKEALKTLDDFAYSIIADREAQGLGNLVGKEKAGMGAGAGAEGQRQDLLSLYMALRDESGQPMSRKALRDSVLNLIIAGRDTTGQALAWTFFRLLAEPELLAPIREEVDANPIVDYDSYKNMNQTIAAFHEGLRLHPVVPKNAWVALGDDQIPGGPSIKKGDLVRWGDWEMGRDTEIWGEDAAEFKPSRWIDEDGELVRPSQYKFHAFNAGPRLCLGQTLATFEAVSIIAAIVRDFDIAFAPDYHANVEKVRFENTPRYQESLTLPLLDPLMVTVTKRPL